MGEFFCFEEREWINQVAQQRLRLKYLRGLTG
jgi:hypothetical protein